MVPTSVNQEVANLFDQRGEEYAQAWVPLAKQRLGEFEAAVVRGAIARAQPKNPARRLKVLDVGVGTGRIAQILLENEIDFYGVDIAPAMVELCRKKLAGNENLRDLRVQDILDPLPVEWGQFDLVTAVRVISYTPLWREALRRIYEILASGGVLMFTFPNRNSTALVAKAFLGNEYKGFEVTYRDLQTLLKEIGFVDVQITGFARLLDTFYDRCNSRFSAGLLIDIEKFLRALLGPTRGARLFYVTCRKP